MVNQRNQEKPTGFERFWDSAPMRSVKGAGKLLLDYPSMARDNLIQLVGEARETQKERGNLAALGNLGREALSTQFDVASFLTGGVVPRSIGDYIDPSKNTQLGMQVQDAQQQFRDIEGRDPSMSERYEIMRSVQDQAMPWLAEDKNILGMDISNRTLVGLPVEAAAIAGEIGLTAGTATAARFAARQGVKQVAKMGQKYGGKIASVNLDPTQRIVQAGSKLTEEALLLPTRLDKLTGAMITKPLGLAKGWTIGGARITKNAMETLFNRTKNQGIEAGNAPDEVTQILQQEGKKWVDAGDIEGKRPGEAFSLDEFEVDKFIDDDMSNTSPYTDRLKRNEEGFLYVEDRPLSKPDTMSSISPYADESLLTFKESDFNLLGVGEDLDPLYDSGSFITKGSSIEELGSSKTKSKKESISEYFADMEININNSLANINGKLTSRSKLIPEIFRDRAKLTDAEKHQSLVSTRVKKKLRDYWDRAQNILEGHSSIARNQTIEGIAVLQQLFPKLIRTNVGRQGLAKSINSADNSEIVIAENIQELVKSIRQGKEINFTFSDEGLREAGILDKTFKGHTIVSKEYQGQKYFDQRRGEWINPNMLPGYSDLVERKSLYRDVLKSLYVDLDEATIKKLRGGNVELGIMGFTPNSRITAWDIVEKLADVPAKWESLAYRLNIIGARRGSGVLYKAGDSYQPRSVIGQINSDGILIKEAKELELSDSYRLSKDQTFSISPVRKRTYASQAEGMEMGQVYLHPALANEDYIKFVGNHKVNQRIGQGLRVVSEENLDGRFGTMKELLGEKTINRYNQNLGKIKSILRSAYSRKTIDGSYLASKSARELIGDFISGMEVEGRLMPKITADNAGTAADIASTEMRRLGENFAGWEEAINKIAKTNALQGDEKKILENALRTAKYEHSLMSGEVKSRMGTLTGLGLEGQYFPVILRDSILDFKKEIDRINNPSKLREFFMKYNSMFRTFGATGDFSAIGIQGWTALLAESVRRLERLPGNQYTQLVKELGIDKQGNAFTALVDSMKVFGENGNNIVSEFFQNQERLAKIYGLPGPTAAINQGLAVVGSVPDFYKFDVGPLKAFDRSFTHYGNILRYQLFQSEMIQRMADTGLDAAQLMARGDGAELASIVNTITGVGRRGFGGDIGQFALFAPRFFQARWKTLEQAIKGTGKVFIPGQKATIQERVARQYMTRMLGIATFITISANEMMGEETDVMPFKQNEGTGEYYYNPNFMRIHAGDLDFSLLGPHDTMLRIAYIPVQALQNSMSTGVDFDIVLNSMRGVISAPVATTTADLVAGEDGIGQLTRESWEIDEDGNLKNNNVFDSLISTKTTGYLASNLVPFALEDLLIGDPGRPSVRSRGWQGGKDLITGGDAGRVEGAQDLATAVGQGAGQIFGLKSSYESVNESLDEVYASILELGPTDERLQDVFNMSENELREYLAETGSGVYDSGKLKLSRLRGDEKTIDFSDVAADYRKTIKKMSQEGGFANILSPEDWEKAQKNIDDRLRNSASSYTQYQIERDKLIDKEQTDLQSEEDVFIESGMVNRSTYFKELQKIRRNAATNRRNLTGEGGKYRDIDELFEFGRKNSLGKMTNTDSDIYDFANALYYDKLYGEEDNIINDKTGEVDWNKRDDKIMQWSEEIKQKYPSLKDSDVKSYLLRITRSAKKDAPPIATAMLDMSDKIADSGYYDIEKNIVASLVSKDPSRESGDRKLALYDEWKKQTPKDKEITEKKDIRFFTLLNKIKLREKRKFFSENPNIESMLQIIGKYDTKPVSRQARLVDGVFRQHQRKPMPVNVWLSFFRDIVSNELSYEQLYKKYYRS